ncbi:MAG: hypothetical protein N3G78_09555 [Desulfobacterota bacterium]|nr:hypothetical protein [Thermodesulfobacteriota bacterium]
MEDRQIRIFIQVFLNLVVLLLYVWTEAWFVFLFGLVLANGLAFAFLPTLNGLASLVSSLIFGSAPPAETYRDTLYREDLYQARRMARESRWEEAVALYRKILEMAPDQVEVRYELAMVYQKAGLLGKALLEYRMLRDSKERIGADHPFVLEAERQIENLKRMIAGRDLGR